MSTVESQNKHGEVFFRYRINKIDECRHSLHFKDFSVAFQQVSNYIRCESWHVEGLQVNGSTPYRTEQISIQKRLK